MGCTRTVIECSSSFYTIYFEALCLQKKWHCYVCCGSFCEICGSTLSHKSVENPRKQLTYSRQLSFSRQAWIVVWRHGKSNTMMWTIPSHSLEITLPTLDTKNGEGLSFLLPSSFLYLFSFHPVNSILYIDKYSRYDAIYSLSLCVMSVDA